MQMKSQQMRKSEEKKQEPKKDFLNLFVLFLYSFLD